ncbi:MAG: hypothetical protein KGI60_02135 [Patescibacteria group bacterium]|nr:hypothetical protein [Patescibacteria group bacterium]
MEGTMRRLNLADPYITRADKKIFWKRMPVAYRKCVERAIAYYNTGPTHLQFIDWMMDQPELMQFFVNGLRMTRNGKRSGLYELCRDILHRIFDAEGISFRLNAFMN